MNRYLLVARHEFITQLRRKSFLFMAFLFPVLMAGMSMMPTYLMVQDEERVGSLGQVGYVDLSGVLATAAAKPDEYISFADETAAQSALQAKEIGAYFVLADDYIMSGQVDVYAATAVSQGEKSQFSDFIRANLLAEQEALRGERLQAPVSLARATIDGSRLVDEETFFALLILPLLFAVLFGLSINLTASFMMQNVVEEKETRMVEMMITSIRPLDLLWGKIIGLSALGLLQIIVWVAMGSIALIVRQDWGEQLANVHFPWWLMLLGVGYLLLGYILYGSLLSGIGAATASMQEAQSVAAIFSVLAIAPIFALGAFLQNANGFWPIFLSLFPLTAPTSMMIRVSLSAVPAWQIGLSLILMIATTVFIVWLAAWVFQLGLLMTGQRLRLRSLLGAIRSNGEIIEQPNPQTSG